ncbi:hypothetical protein AAVH_19581 [Aphelenchoides avenae]|nr:hypothetical protein AAVH_36269 [Aphelenchus avenae]KAH7713060.1 hypothetical protein AAVH_19581 [Aphelenchus avenae]
MPFPQAVYPTVCHEPTPRWAEPPDRSSVPHPWVGSAGPAASLHHPHNCSNITVGLAGLPAGPSHHAMVFTCPTAVSGFVQCTV